MVEEFAFLPEIPIDTAHTLDQLTGRFKSVKEGAPELVKNAKDQYSRLGVHDRDKRQIVVLADTERQTLGVLDFAGAQIADFAGWHVWSSRTAGRAGLADDIEAGHGNGGKAFMVHGATDMSFLESCFKGRRTRMGFQNDRTSVRYKPGYGRLGGTTLNNVADDRITDHLQAFLAEFGASIDSLPEKARALFISREAFTGVLLRRVTEWEGRQKRVVLRLAHSLPEIVATHGQTALTIETCEVWAIVDGELITSTPICPVPLEPHPGFEEPLVSEIPKKLTDPETGESVNLASANGTTGELHLHTSKRHLQLSEDLKARNVIRIWNSRNNVATWSLPSMGVIIPAVSFLYGELRCPALVGEHLTGAERVHLADTPLTRALRSWTAECIEDLAEKLHKAQMGETKPKDREHANQALRYLRDLMRRFLDPEAAGIEEEDEDLGGEQGSNGRGRKRRHSLEYGSRLDEIVLESGRSSIAVANGTAVPLVWRCLEREDDGTTKPVRDVKVLLKSSRADHVTLFADHKLRAELTGDGEIWLETEDGSVTSNRVHLVVVEAAGIDVIAPDEPLLQAQRTRIRTTFHTSEGPRDDLLLDATVDEPGMGILSRTGRFTAGLREGKATVRIKYGPMPTDHESAVINVSGERVPPTGQGGDQGADIPHILLCGEEAPGMEDYPKDQRTHRGGEEYPTIIEEPQFRNVVWINPNSKEAMRVRRSRGGPSGVGGVATQTFMHFVALKCFDILKRLFVRQQIRDRTVTETEFIQHAALAEIECADFIDAAWELSDKLLGKGAELA